MSGGKTQSYIDRVIARARELHESDAFAPADLPGNTLKASNEASLSENNVAPTKTSSAALAKIEKATSKRIKRTLTLAFLLICIIVAAFSLLLPYYGIDAMDTSGGEIYSPKEVLACYKLWFQMNVMPLIDSSYTSQIGRLYSEFCASYPDVVYSLVINRAVVTILVVVCAIMLAVSGLLFQTSFRNPLATPSMLGVSDGVTLGCIIFAMLGNNAISDDPKLYLLLVFGLGVLVVVFVLVSSRAMSGGARYNVLDMLLLGTVVCQLIGGVNSFIQNFVMDEYAWYSFYDIQQASNALVDPLIQLVIVVVFIVTVIPALLLSFKFNLIAFSDEEGTMMGVRAGALRMAALALGSIMQLAAIASIGQVAMLSLAVPFLVRYMMPADFRSQFLGNCLVGVFVLLACMAIQHFANIGAVTMPVGTIVSVFIVPFFVWMMAFGKGRW